MSFTEAELTQQGVYDFQDLLDLGTYMYRLRDEQHDTAMIALAQYVPNWICKFEVDATNPCEYVPNTRPLLEILEEMLRSFQQEQKKRSTMVSLDATTRQLIDNLQ